MRDSGAFHDDDVIVEWNGADNGMVSARSRDLPEHLSHLTGYEEASRALSAELRTIVTPTGWKFTCSPIGEHELFNLRADPGETENLIDDAAVGELVADLHERLLAWQARTGDEARLAPNPRLR